MKNVKQQQKPGYVLIATMMIVGLALTLVAAILSQSMGFLQIGSLFRQKEQARSLALGAIQLGISQINFIAKPTNQTSQAEVEGEMEPKGNEQKQIVTEQWLKQLLKVINTWHTVTLDTAIDNIAAQVSWYIAAEQGKFSLSYLDKLVKNKQKQQEQLKKTDLESNDKTSKTSKKEASPNEEAQKSFEQVINDRVINIARIPILDILRDLPQVLPRPFDDPSDLFMSSYMQKFTGTMFIQKDKAANINLFDLFTVWSNSGTLNPWLLSTQTAKTLGLSRNAQVDIDKITKNFKLSASWQHDWDSSLGELYGKKFKNLPQDIRQLFSMQFTATAFSIAIEVKLNKITQRLYVLVEEQQQTDPKQKNKIFTITRLYWL